MEIRVQAQGHAFLAAVLLGLGLSLAYDLLRGPRRLWRRLAWLLDLSFGAWFFWCMVWFWLVPAGGWGG